MEHHFISTNGIQLHVVQAGPLDGPLVILLHGFPEFWYGWRYQLDFLAKAGYRVWVPDQRGYNLSDKPKGISSYRIDALAADVVGLIDAAGREKAFLIGHDWGAAVSWWLAAQYPERLEKLVIINVPHPSVMARIVLSRPSQLLKSWYILAFQVPGLPELFSRFNDWNALCQTLRKSSRAGTFLEDELSRYRKAWSQPNAFTSMVNWYRAAIQKRVPFGKKSRITVPTLMIWGAQDQFLIRDMASPSIDLCDQGELVFFEEATHWVHHEEADQVNRLLTHFFKKLPSPS